MRLQTYTAALSYLLPPPKAERPEILPSRAALLVPDQKASQDLRSHEQQGEEVWDDLCQIKIGGKQGIDGPRELHLGLMERKE